MQEKLRSLYKKDPNNKLPSFLEEEEGYESIESSYINLAIVDIKAQQEREARLVASSNGTGQEIDSPEDIIDEGNTINIESLFINGSNKKKDKGKEKVGISSNDNDDIKEIEESEEQLTKIHKKVLIYGKAGIGKTTLMKYITYQWANERLWNQFYYVFLLPLRKLNNFQKTNHHDGMESFIIECCLSDGEGNLNIKKNIQEVNSILSNNKTLLLLDGYDEFNPKEENKDFVKSIFNAVVNHSKLSIIMTSRPNMVENRYKELFDYQLVNIGFSNVNIDDYIEKNFTGNEEEKQSLYKLIRENKTIQGMCHTPLNLHLFCLVWVDLLNENQSKIESQEFSTTSLYVEIVDWLIRRYAKKIQKKDLKYINNLKHEQIEKDYEDLLKIQERIAYEGLNKGKLVLEKGTLIKLGVNAESYEKIYSMGLLKAIDGNELEANGNSNKGKEKSAIEIRGNIDKEHYFIHLTFQEYMAARCLVRMLNSGDKYQVKEAVEFLDNDKYTQRYERMICFIAGIVSLNKEQSPQPSQALLHFWNVMINGKVDLSIVKQLNLIIKCMDESSIDEKIPDIGNIKDYLKDTIQNITRIKGRRALGKIPERIEKWLEIAGKTKEMNISQETVLKIKQYLDKLNSSINEYDRIKIIEELTQILSNNFLHKELVIRKSVINILEVLSKLLIPLLKEPENRISEKAAQILGNLAIQIEDQKLKSLVIEALIRGGMEAAELGRQIEVISERKYQEEPYAFKSKKFNGLYHSLASPLPSDLNIWANFAEGLLLDLKNSDREKVGYTAYQLIRLVNNVDNNLQIRIIESILPIFDNKNKYIQTKLIESVLTLGWKVKLNIIDSNLQTKFLESLFLLIEKNKNIDVQVRATKALGKINATDINLQKILKFLLSLFEKNVDQYVQIEATEVLGKFDIIDNKRQAQLIKFLLFLIEKDNNKDIRMRAIEALGRLNTIIDAVFYDKIVSILLPLLKDKEMHMSLNAIYTLSTFYTVDEQFQNEVINSIAPILVDDNKNIRQNAVRALCNFDTTDQKFQEKIIKSLSCLLQKGSKSICIKIAEILKAFDIKDTDFRNDIIKSILYLFQDRKFSIDAIEALSDLDTTDLTLQNKIIDRFLSLLKFKKLSMNVTEALCKLSVIDLNIQIQIINSITKPLLRNKDKKIGDQIASILNRFLNQFLDKIYGLYNIDNDLETKIFESVLPLLAYKGRYESDIVIKILEVCHHIIDESFYQEALLKVVAPLLKESSNFYRAEKAMFLMKYSTIEVQNKLVKHLLPLFQDSDQWTCDTIVNILKKLKIEDSNLQTTIVRYLLDLCKTNNSQVVTNAVKALDRLGINILQFAPHAITELIEILNISKNDNNADLVFRVIHILNALQISNSNKLREIFICIIKQLTFNNRNAIILPLYITSLLNLYLEQLLISNIMVTLTSDILKLLSLPLFKQAAIVVDQDKIIINYRGYQREMPFAEGEDKADMAYKVFSYFYKEHQLSGTATELLNHRLNFSKAIQVSGFDIELGNVTLAKSILQQQSYSCVNSTIRLNCQQWMISIMRKARSVGNAQHAFLVIEGRNIFGEAELYRLELLQPNAKQFPERGQIEIDEKRHINISIPDELARVFQIILGNTHYNGNNRFIVEQDYYHKSCLVTRDIAIQIVNQAKAEKARAAEVTYDFYGIKAPNCFSWVRKKLRENFEAEQYERLEIEKAGERYVDPLAYLGPTVVINTRVTHYAKDGMAAVGKAFGGK